MSIEQFDAWWDENEEKFLSDSNHMSQYHMASVVWEAAEKATRLTCCNPESIEYNRAVPPAP